MPSSIICIFPISYLSLQKVYIINANLLLILLMQQLRPGVVN